MAKPACPTSSSLLPLHIRLALTATVQTDGTCTHVVRHCRRQPNSPPPPPTSTPPPSVPNAFQFTTALLAFTPEPGNNRDATSGVLGGKQIVLCILHPGDCVYTAGAVLCSSPHHLLAYRFCFSFFEVALEGS